jgi:hypothetical protein
MYERALKTREPSFVLRTAKPFLFLWFTACRGLWNTWQHRSSPLRKAELRAVGHVAAPEFLSQEGRTQSCGTRGSTGAHLIKEVRTGAEGTRASAGAHLSKEARSGAVGHVVAPELPSQEGRDRSGGIHDSAGAHFRKKAMFEAAGHVVVSKHTSAGMYCVKIQLT